MKTEGGIREKEKSRGNGRDENGGGVVKGRGN